MLLVESQLNAFCASTNFPALSSTSDASFFSFAGAFLVVGESAFAALVLLEDAVTSFAFLTSAAGLASAEEEWHRQRIRRVQKLKDGARNASQTRPTATATAQRVKETRALRNSSELTSSSPTRVVPRSSLGSPPPGFTNASGEPPCSRTFRRSR